MPSGNAMVISASPRDVASLTGSLKSLVPKGAAVEPLVAWTSSGGSASGGGTVSSVGVGASAPVGTGTGAGTGTPAGTGATMTPAEISAMLQAALSRRGMPYVWGAAGPQAFDCSGLVEWSFAQAGVTMPRVAADQALTGAVVPVSQLAAGDLLFYRTDPTDPGYISHVAIYLGNGWMIQAPQPGMDVQVVPVDVSTEFAGAIRVEPRVAAALAGGI
jgi:cell wall-associated NlpC family hydrolase